MNWRIGLALIFLLILLFAVLNMAMYVIPPIHNAGPVFQNVPSADAIGQISENTLYPIPDDWRTMQIGEDVSIYPNGMQYDVSGNVVYPFVTPMKI
uniref:Uncharacterized protein n=1 Tax=viral metagenome TaxID=1070528 RepID=A0A6C0KP14_9ZZZZ